MRIEIHYPKCPNAIMSTIYVQQKNPKRNMLLIIGISPGNLQMIVSNLINAGPL